jgi:hypothetical protein
LSFSICQLALVQKISIPDERLATDSGPLTTDH